MSQTITTADQADKLLEGKYLTFALSEEKYGLQILKVQEIIGILNITQVPQSPSYLKGVVNLRGKIIPVVDLRLKFGMEEIPYDDKTCVVVVECSLGGRILSVGVVVDTVLEVANFTAKQIEQAPEYGSSLESSFIVGMGRAEGNHVIILIDIDRALADAVGSLASAQASGSAELVH